jgi:hypothetical protein
MRRILMLLSVAAMLGAVMALSGVAQARPISGSADAKCAKLAIKSLGASFNPGTYTFDGGTELTDVFTGNAGQPDVFCGFGGDDDIGYIVNLDEGDIFLGGAGNDNVGNSNYGTFYGGEGTDYVNVNYGTFYGGAGDDVVGYNHTGGTFFGEGGDDYVFREYGGTFEQD